jgi:hypothetical protein
MLSELRDLLDAVPADAPKSSYRDAIMDENVLGKKTTATRRESYERLGWFYAIEPRVPLFRLLRFFWDCDDAARPVLALTCAAARDPLLRMTAATVLDTPVGNVVSNEAFESAVANGTRQHFNPPTRIKIARNAASSWTHAGYLEGRRIKRRVRPMITCANVAYNFVLGYAEGVRGPLLLETFWTKLLATSRSELTDLAIQASQRGWLHYRQVGSVIDITFSDLLSADERRLLHEQD